MKENKSLIIVLIAMFLIGTISILVLS